MVMRSDGSFTLEEPDAAASQLGVTPHTVSFHKVLSFFMPLWDWELSKYFPNQVRFTTKVILEDPGEVEAVLGRVQVDLLSRRASARSNFRRLLRRDFKAAILFWIGIVRESSKWNPSSFRCSLLFERLIMTCESSRWNRVERKVWRMCECPGLTQTTSSGPPFFKPFKVFIEKQYLKYKYPEICNCNFRTALFLLFLTRIASICPFNPEDWNGNTSSVLKVFRRFVAETLNSASEAWLTWLFSKKMPSQN